MAKTAKPVAQEYEWTKEIFGRQPKQIETIDPAKEPRLAAWINGGLVVKKGEPWPKPNAPTPGEAVLPKPVVDHILAGKETPNEDGDG